MKTNHLLIALILFAAMMLASCSSRAAPGAQVPEGTQAGDLSGLEKCEFQPANSNTKYIAECGTLVVPENWEVAGSRLIVLPVVRIPASGRDPAEPVFWLEGGPGGTNFTWAPPAWLLAKHAVVLVGYRGVDGTVNLSCPAVGRLLKAHTGKDLFSEQAHVQYVAAVDQCATTLQDAGVDLSGYNMPGVIEDMEAARTALGYRQIDLFSVSYGTRIAQLYAYLHPASLRRLVLAGVNTPGHFIWRPAVLDGILGHISELCTKDPDCSSQTTDFAQTMYTVNHNMPKRWLLFNIDPDTVRVGTHSMFFSNGTMPMIFDAYLAAAEGDPSGLAMLNLLVTLMMPADQTTYGDQFSKGGTADLDKYAGPDSIALGNSIMGAPLSELVWPLAEEWPIELIPQSLRNFQETDVEMLLISGTVDFSTPPSALDEARPYFHKAQILRLPEFSHVGDVYTLQPQAFQRLITTYYDTGVADDSLYVYQPLSFKPGISLTVLAKLMMAAIVLLPALLILGIVLVMRRIRSRRRLAASHRQNADQDTNLATFVQI